MKKKKSKKELDKISCGSAEASPKELDPQKVFVKNLTKCFSPFSL